MNTQITILPVLLALGTALGYGVANYVAPVLGRRMPLAAVLLGSQLAGLAVSLLLTLGTSTAMTGAGLGLALAAGACNAGALACFYRAGRTGDLSVVSPIGASGAVIPVLVGLLLGERPGPLQLAGIPLVLVGIVLAARRAPSPRAPADPTPVAAAPADAAPVDGASPDAAPVGRVPSRGIGWALLAAALFGIFLVTYARAAADSAAGALLWSRVALVTATALGVLVARAPLRVRPRDGMLVLVPGLLLALGTFAYGEATRSGLLSVVSVIATLNPVVTVVLAFLLLRERPGQIQRIGAGVALAGVVLLAV